ncbi:MAG: HEAT repeat domain-containing protein, partial [Bradymonadaceae bacterium]
VVSTFEDALIGEDSQDRVRRRAVRVYGDLLGEEAVPVLASLLDHSDVHTRAAAVEALEDIGTPEALEALSNRVDDSTTGAQ